MTDITVNGIYVRTTPDEIEGSFDGGAYATVDATPAGGTFSGTLSGSGQGTLAVRWVDYPDNPDEVAYVGVGDNFIIAGQSNMQEPAANNQSYSHATLKASALGRATNTWRELGDTGQAESFAKSCWPLVATSFMANQNVPVCFVQCAEGSTSITEWQKPGTLYSRITAQFAKVVSAKCVLWQIGETDAPNDMSQVDFQTYLSQLVDDVFADTGLDMMISKLQSCSAYTSGQQATINAAIDYVVTNNAHAIAGPDFSDYTITSNPVHFQSDAEILVQATRWWAAIQTSFGW